MDAAFEGVEVLDATACALCDTALRNEYGLYSARRSCNLQRPRPCAIEGFWHERQDELTALAGYASDALPGDLHTPHVQRALSAAQAVVEQGAVPRGRRCSADLSDAVIVCESVPGAVLITSNLRDFQALVTIVGGARQTLPVTLAPVH